MISTTRIRRFVLAATISAGVAPAQTPSLQDLQNKLVQFEESTQKTITELKAQIAALQQGQKAARAAPAPRTAPQTHEVPVVHRRRNTMAPKPGPDKPREKTRRRPAYRQ